MNKIENPAFVSQRKESKNTKNRSDRMLWWMQKGSEISDISEAQYYLENAICHFIEQKSGDVRQV
jgi:hypothetical protein